MLRLVSREGWDSMGFGGFRWDSGFLLRPCNHRLIWDSVGFGSLSVKETLEAFVIMGRIGIRLDSVPSISTKPNPDL